MAGLLPKVRKLPILVLLPIFCWLTGCATSNISRDAAENIEVGVLNLKNMSNLSETGLGDAYQNTSQAIKGGVFGGAAGALAGSMTSVGILPATAAGVILGATYGMYLDTNMDLRDRLENRGWKVIILGDQVMIEVPSARVFEPLTPRIKQQAYETLQMLAQFINRYNKTLVKISVYTTKTNSFLADQALSEQQAISLEKYLILSGLNARLLYAQGYGGTNLVQENDLTWFGNENYRVVLTFEKLFA